MCGFSTYIFKKKIFLQGSQHQLWRAVFQLCPVTYNTIFSRFNNWIAEAMGVKFLAQGNNSSRKPQMLASNLEPYDYQADALAVCYCLPMHKTLA